MSSTQLYTQDSMLGRSRSRSRSMSRPSRKRSRGRSPSVRSDVNLSSAIMVPRSVSSGPVYTFTRWCNISSVYGTTDGSSTGTIVSVGSPDIIYQGLVTLNLLPNQSEFTNLFSQFKITELEYHFINQVFTEVNITQASGVTPSVPTARNVPVYILAQNDSLGTTTIQQMQQESNVIVRTFTNDGKPFILKVKKPTFFTPGFDGTSIINNAEEKNGWLDTQTAAAVQYRGMALGIENAYSLLGAPSTAFPAMNGRVKMTVQFKGVR